MIRSLLKNIAHDAVEGALNKRNYQGQIDNLIRVSDELLRKIDEVLNKQDALSDRINDLNRLEDERTAHILWLVELINGRAIEETERLAYLQSMCQYGFLGQNGNVEQSSIYKRIRSLQSLLAPMDPDMPQIAWRRVGRSHDGGYVMLDDLNGTSVAYSLGICDDVSWDKDMARHGTDIFMYDHTIEALPEENPHFHWHKVGICGQYNEAYPDLKPLPDLIEENGHAGQYGMVLKMDIEGFEWDVFNNISRECLLQFNQIVLEMHDLTRYDRYDEIVSGLKRLHETHQVVYIHANNWSPYQMVGGLVMPDVLEVTCLSRENYQFRETERVFPSEMDEENRERFPDIFLGKWKG